MGGSMRRRVVTGIVDGVDVIVADGPAPNSVDAGAFVVSEVYWSDGAPRSVGDPIDRTTPGYPLEPPAGGASARIIRMPGIPEGVDPDDTWLRVDGDDADTPGMHATDTLDLMVVLEGSVVMGLPDGDRVIGPGEYVVQRGTAHRWRPADAHGWTYFVAMLRPDASISGAPTDVITATSGEEPVRRVVTGSPVIDGGAAKAVRSPSTTMTDIWHTGGPVADTVQGGDPDDPWRLEPVEGGAWIRQVELTPGPPIDGGWHRTRTVDIDVVLRGAVLLELPSDISTVLGPGDVVVQRGTDHRWTAVGDEQFVMASVMFDAQW